MMQQFGTALEGRHPSRAKHKQAGAVLERVLGHTQHDVLYYSGA